MGQYCTSIDVDTTVTVDIDWEDLDTTDMIKELERRKAIPAMTEFPTVILERIYIKRKLGEQFNRELDDLIYQVIGRIV
jgi:hypothetical protein